MSDKVVTLPSAVEIERRLERVVRNDQRVDSYLMSHFVVKVLEYACCSMNVSDFVIMLSLELYGAMAKCTKETSVPQMCIAKWVYMQSLVPSFIDALVDEEVGEEAKAFYLQTLKTLNQ